MLSTEKTTKQQKNRKTYKPNNKKYRGRGKINSRSREFVILLANLRGITSKQISLEKVLTTLKPSVVAINETQLSGNSKVSLRSYSTWSRNRSEQGGGGIATAVRDQFRDSAVGVGEGKEKDEYLVTRIECFSPALSIVNCYGEQRRLVKEEVDSRWSRLRTELDSIRARGDFCLVAGDLNKLVGCDVLGVPGNDPEVSYGGKLLQAMLASKNWYLVNGLGEGVVKGGSFTREDPASGKLFCLDIFVVSKELRPFVSSMLIDSKRNLKIARSVKVQGREELNNQA